LEAVGGLLGVDGGLCKRILKAGGVPDDFLRAPEEFTLGSATLNEKGFPLHLAGVQVFLLRLLNLEAPRQQILNAAANVLASREPNNPFFLFLREGKTERVQQSVLRLCPALDRPSRKRFQWAWERTEAEKAWEESMYWDCIFLGQQLRS
jgi:hypothetical protein